MIIKYFGALFTCVIFCSCFTKKKEVHISNFETFNNKLKQKKQNLVTEVTDSIFQMVYQRNEFDDLKQFHAVFKFKSADTIENVYSGLSQFFQIDLDSTYKRFIINANKSISLNQSLKLLVIDDKFVQDFLGVGGIVIVQISSNNDLVCISVCDKYQIKNSTHIVIYKEVRDKVYATELRYKPKVCLFLPHS